MTIHSKRRPLPHEGLFWRRLAHWGASKGPEWWVRYSPPVFGWAAAALVPSARRAVRKNLHRIRGPKAPARDAADVLSTFSTYASCLAEVLSNDAEEGPRQPFATISRSDYLAEARAHGRGVILVTAHTAGWEAVGPLFAAHHGLEMMIVMQPEPDARARELQDHARRRAGVTIVHVGDDPLASLPLLRHLRGNGAIALQLDRIPPGMRTHEVTLLGERARIPEGPLRLAQVSGATVVPVFCARLAYREYAIVMYPGRQVSRHATKEEVDDVAQHLATSMTDFLRSHPTQWFHWDER